MLYTETQWKTGEIDYYDEKYYLKCKSRPTYMSQKILDKYLVVMCKSKVALTLNKPACIVICILELSKVLMYEFHYDYIENKYDNKSKLLFTDTDSLMYVIKIEVDCENFNINKEMFDFSISQNTIMIHTN